MTPYSESAHIPCILRGTLLVIIHPPNHPSTWTTSLFVLKNILKTSKLYIKASRRALSSFFVNFPQFAPRGEVFCDHHYFLLISASEIGFSSCIFWIILRLKFNSSLCFDFRLFTLVFLKIVNFQV